MTSEYSSRKLCRCSEWSKTNGRSFRTARSTIGATSSGVKNRSRLSLNDAFGICICSSLGPPNRSGRYFALLSRMPLSTPPGQ